MHVAHVTRAAARVQCAHTAPRHAPPTTPTPHHAMHKTPLSTAEPERSTHTRTHVHAPSPFPSDVNPKNLSFFFFCVVWIGLDYITDPRGEPKTRGGRPSVREACRGQESSCQETRHTTKCVLIFFLLNGWFDGNFDSREKKTDQRGRGRGMKYYYCSPSSGTPRPIYMFHSNMIRRASLTIVFVFLWLQLFLS